MTLRIKFVSSVTIDGEDLEDIRRKFDDMELTGTYDETILVEDEDFKDYTFEFNHI